ncbi:hypothetical protein ACLMJK_006454 [Lecanora helva]
MPNAEIHRMVRSTISANAKSSRLLSRRCSSLSSHRLNANPIELLNDLDGFRHGDIPLRDIAANDSVFLSHELRSIETIKNLHCLSEILNLTSIVFIRLHSLSNSSIKTVEGDVYRDDFKCIKFIANLEHLLRCLQQITLDAINNQVANLVEAYVLHWHNYWQHQNQGWFAEWPNSHRPLSTTWPWNVRPSLLVLWGVCWMFYGYSSIPTSNPHETRNRRGAAQIPEMGGDFWTRHLGSQSEPVPQALQPDPSDAWTDPPSQTYPNYSWLHPMQAGVAGRRANATSISQSVVPSYQASLAANPYITTTVNESSDLFATSTVQWPYCQGINQDPPPAYDPSYVSWQPSYDANSSITGSLTATPPRLDSQTPLQTYASQRQLTNTQAAVARVGGSLGFGLGLHRQEMQDYPSPHSNVSEQTSTSSCLSVLPGAAMMSPPGRTLVLSPSMVPSLEASTNSRPSSRNASGHPPRNPQGMLYCDHVDCREKPPVFSRKCEWTKHMDKHTRPYICDEPSCDNIRGFTYSGGLLRHQREVHHQHGGPKASCMCPHKDCKRSTGVGFSRRENLNEHLRRCHQPPPMQQRESQDAGGGEIPRPKKRRRAPDDDDVNEAEGEREGDAALQREVKKLRKELAEKDERLKRLEKMMESLTKAQHGGG